MLFPQQRCTFGSPCGVTWGRFPVPKVSEVVEGLGGSRGFGLAKSYLGSQNLHPSPAPKHLFPNLVSKTWFSRPCSTNLPTRFPDLQPGSPFAWLKHIEAGFPETRCSGNLHQPRLETPNTFVYVRNRRREVLLEPPRGSHRRLQREPASEILWKATVLDGGGKMCSRHLRWHNIHEHVRWTNCQTWHTWSHNSCQEKHHSQ